jgi:two-component system, NtrC family, sensor kinase
MSTSINKPFSAPSNAPSTENYEKVLAERNLLLKLIDSLPDCIYAKDEDGRFTISNRANNLVLGKDRPQDVIGKTDFDFFDKSFAEQYRMDEIQLMHFGENVVNVEEVGVDNRTGKERWVSTTKVLLKNEHEAISGIFGIGRDITRRKEAESKLIEAMRAAKLASWELDFRTMTVHANDRYFEIFGTTVDQVGSYELPAHIILEEFIHPDSLLKTQEVFEHLASGGEMNSFEHQGFHRASGAVIELLVYGLKKIFDADGKLIKTVGTIQDITERKKADEKLKVFQHRLESLIRTVPGVIYRNRLDASHTMEYVSDYVETLTGYPAAEFIDGNIRTLGSLVFENDLERVRQITRTALARKEPYIIEYRLTRKDGAMRWVVEYGRATYNLEGKALYEECMVFDITDRKLAAEESERLFKKVHESEARFDQMTKNAPGMIYQFSLDPKTGQGSFTFASNYSFRIYGLSPQVLCSMPLEELSRKIHPEDTASFQTKLLGSATSMSDFIWEGRLQNITGDYLWVKAVSSPRLSDNGKIIWDGVMMDITEQKALQSELQATLRQIAETQNHLVQSEKMSALGQMVAGIAHELNTPIGYASNNVSLIRERFKLLTELYGKSLKAQAHIFAGELEPALADMQAISASPNGSIAELDETVRRTDRLFTGISSGFDQMTNLVRSMRNFARLDESDMKKADINEGVRNCLLMVGHMLKDKDVDLTTDYNDLPMVDCYPAQLNQVFLNLIGNAIHAAEDRPDGGTVRVETRYQDNQVVVRITDNGKGIPKSVQSKIFDPFFTTKPVGKGTGLGLSISYDIIKKHNGDISFQSEEGKGTTFIVKIPAVEFLLTDIR